VEITSLDMAVIDIEKALQTQMYYIALVCTLSLIDICSALESKDGTTDKYAYMNWYKTHLGPHYTWLSDQDCYGLRCGMLHQGILDPAVRNMPQSRWARIGFILTPGGSQLRQLASSDHYFTGLAEFCRDVVARVKDWANSKKGDPVVKKNGQRLMRLHPQGIPPHITGIPILS